MNNNVHIQRPKDSNLYSGLFQYVDDLKNKYNMQGKTMIEIGCYQGESTEIFATIFDKIYAIDPWQNGYDINDISSHATDMSLVEKTFDERMKNYSGLIKHKKTAKQFFDTFDRKIDFIYIDGDHRYDAVIQDLKYGALYSKYIGGHDFGTFAIEKALKDFLDIDNLYHGIISIYPDSSWIINKEF